jgi:hypothetical protein
VVNDLQVLRYDLTKDQPAAANNEMVQYVVFGKTSTVVVLFMTDDAHVGALKPLAQQTMAGVALPPLQVPGTWEDQDPEPRYGEMLGRALAWVGVLVLLVLGVRRMLKRASRPTSSTTPPPPPSSPGPLTP